jgi:phosphoglycerate dehydrogenase-like enzyme
MKLVIHPPADNARLERIRTAAESMQIVNASTPGDAARELADADAFFGKMTPELLDKARKLRWVQSPTASLEHYMFPALAEHPCQLTNMRGLYSDVIADHVFGYILCFARNFHRYIRQQMQSHWEPAGGESERAAFVTGPGVMSAIDQAHIHLADTTLGVVGLGEIGSEIARRGQAFHMRVIAVDRFPKSEPVTAWGMERLSDLLGQSDFVVIAAPHTPETVKMFRRPQFQQMKRSAYLINIGRGAIVDLTDLAAALAAGEIAGAGLDVFETEPLPSDHPLWKMDNVIITPHVAGYSPRITERHLNVLLENIRRFGKGEPLLNVVNKHLWF